MGRNRNLVNQGNRLMLQWAVGYYLPPKTPQDIEEVVSDLHDLTATDLKQALIDQHKFEELDDDINKLSYYQKNGIRFQFRDGKSDVYTKGGYDTELFELLQRQYTDKVKWRIETNATMKFEPMGKVLIGDKEMAIAKVLNIQTSGTRENKYLAMRNHNFIEQLSTKMLILI